jgi:hypothetical protein
VGSEEKRIQELVEKITAANGTREIIALAKELQDLLEATKQRPRGNLPAEPKAT